MAELHVQPKKRSSALPWILLLLGIAALVYFLTRDKNTDDNNTENTRINTTTSIIVPQQQAMYHLS